MQLTSQAQEVSSMSVFKIPRNGPNFCPTGMWLRLQIPTAGTVLDSRNSTSSGMGMFWGICRGVESVVMPVSSSWWIEAGGDLLKVPSLSSVKESKGIRRAYGTEATSNRGQQCTWKTKHQTGNEQCIAGKLITSETLPKQEK